MLNEPFTNVSRATKGRDALLTTDFKADAPGLSAKEIAKEGLVQTYLGDCIANILHYAEDVGEVIDLQEAIDSAKGHYKAEVEDEKVSA
jgi:hypothetical protein